jgi:hypothetical protein
VPEIASTRLDHSIQFNVLLSSGFIHKHHFHALPLHLRGNLMFARVVMIRVPRYPTQYQLRQDRVLCSDILSQSSQDIQHSVLQCDNLVWYTFTNPQLKCGQRARRMHIDKLPIGITLDGHFVDNSLSHVVRNSVTHFRFVKIAQVDD